jgi:hypothetical protein
MKLNNCCPTNLQATTGSWRLSSVITLVFAALSWLTAANLANAQGGFLCASDGQYCNLPTTHDHFSVGYGSPSRSIIVETENLQVLPCSNALGDPHPGVVKSCNAIEVRKETHRPELSFRRCAGEGQVCNVPEIKGEYSVVRYGANGKWLYNNVGGNVPCSLGSFGFNFDPVPNVPKSCEISTTRLKSAPPVPGSGESREWKICAAEGRECPLPMTNATYLVKYGADSRWLYRTVVGDGIICNAGAFGADPAYGTVKSCQYMVLRSVREILGEWKQIFACGNCGQSEYEITWGVEEGKERSSSSHWTQEVKVSVEADFKVLGTGGSSSIESTTSFGESDSVASSFTQTVGETIKLPCSKGALWQLNTKVDEFCWPGNSSCSTASKTKVYQCAAIGELPKKDWPKDD